MHDGRRRRPSRSAETAAAGRRRARSRPSPSSSPAAARSRGRSPPAARSRPAATSRSASPAKAAGSCACWSTPAAGSAPARCWRSIDRSVQAQQAAQLAAQVQVGARRRRARPERITSAQSSLQGRGFVSKAEIDRKRAARDAAYAQVRVAQAPARRDSRPDRPARHRRPDRGLILARNVEVGQVVSPGSPALVPPRRGRRDGNARADVAAGPGPGSRRHARQRDPGRLGRSFTGNVWQVVAGDRPAVAAGRSADRDPLSTARSGPAALPRRGSPAGTTTAPLLPQSAVLSDDHGQLRLHHQRQERGRAARHQDRLRRRRRRHHRRRAFRQRSRWCCRPGRSSTRGRRSSRRRQAALRGDPTREVEGA